MSYIDAFLERDKDRINVIERVDGKREYRQYSTKYVFYYPDPKGKHRTIHGNPVSRFSTKQIKEIYTSTIYYHYTSYFIIYNGKFFLWYSYSKGIFFN